MNEIKKINVDGVDYDIVSESAEKKIAELEKNNTALASITIGTRDDLQNPVKVGLGERPNDFDSTKDIFICKGVYLSGEAVIIGSGAYPSLEMSWTHDKCFLIKGGYEHNEIKISSDSIKFNGVVVGGSGGGTAGVLLGPEQEIHLTENGGLRFGSDVSSDLSSGLIETGMQITMYNDALNIAHNSKGFSLRISSAAIVCNGKDLLAGAGGGSPVESHDGTKLNLGTEDCSIIAVNEGGYNLQIGKSVSIGNYVRIGEGVDIGTDLQEGKRLYIRGPVYLEAQSGETGLIIGTDDTSCLKIDWGENDKIVFTNLRSGKKATLTLS